MTSKTKNLDALAPEEFIPEICRRTGIWSSALVALCKVAEMQGHSDDPRLHNSLLLAEYLRAGGLFIAQNKDALLAVIKKTGTTYEPLTRAISDALAENTGDPREDGVFFDAAAVLADIERRLTGKREGDGAQEIKGETPPTPSAAEAPLDTPAEKNAAALAEILTGRPATQNSDRIDYLEFVPTPASLKSATIFDILTRAEHGVESLDRLKTRKSTRSAEWSVDWPRPRSPIISRRNDKGEVVEVALKSLDKFEKKRAGGAPKMARLLLTKVGRNMRDGKLASPYIALNAEELVGLGMYQHKKDARRAIRRSADAFGDLKIFAEYLRDGKWRKHWEALVTGVDADFEGDDFFVRLNECLPWSAICAEFTYIPTFYFAIEHSRAATLCEKVFERARMRGRELIDEKEDAFYVNLDPTVMEWLDIPEVGSTNKAREKIKLPVIDSVAEINKKAGAEILRLETQKGEPLSPDLPVRQWITGRLRVDIKGMKLWKSLRGVLKENKKVQNEVAREARREERRENKTGKRGTGGIDDGPTKQEKIKF